MPLYETAHNPEASILVPSAVQSAEKEHPEAWVKEATGLRHGLQPLERSTKGIRVPNIVSLGRQGPE